VVAVVADGMIILAELLAMAEALRLPISIMLEDLEQFKPHLLDYLHQDIHFLEEMLEEQQPHIKTHKQLVAVVAAV